MTASMTFCSSTVLLAPFGVVTAIAAVSYRDGTCACTAASSLHGSLTGRCYGETATPTRRRIDHELDAIRTRFEKHPALAVLRRARGAPLGTTSTASR